jgi:glycerol-3-phosphate dehydrogenase subunit C
MARVTEICDGCRRCHRLCPSFDFMLERVDAHEGEVSKVSSADYRRIVDLCWQCKLCFNHCPYTPPHRWDIDFPRLMLRAKAARAAGEGVTWQDRWLGNIDTLGPLGAATAPLTNWVNGSAPARAVLEKAVGIDRHRTLPRFHHKTFARWFREREPRVAEGHQVAFFTTCVVNYNEPQVGRDAVSVLEKNRCAVSCPSSQVCCGMPFLDGGDLDAARANAKRNLDALLPLVKDGADVVVPQPTCSYVLKKEYPLLVPGEAAETVAAKTRDLFEFLVMRHKEGHLDTEFPGRSPGKVAYQMPCHLRAQNMGCKTRDVLHLIPGTKVTVVERCTAMDGTWGMKKEFYPISLQFARKAAAEMEASEPDTFATDCSLAALQLADVRGARPAHPITLVREAYGLPEER